VERLYNPSDFHEAALKRITPTCAFKGTLEPWRAQLAQGFKQLVGWDDAQPRGPLDVQELEREETETYVRRKLVFSSEPGAHAPCHLLIPRKLSGKAPAVICLQGHTTGYHLSIGQAKFPGDAESIAGDRDFALQAVREGYIALAMEQRCFGERAETKQERRGKDRCEDAAMHALLLGRTMLAERCWDVSRAIDLLETLPEVRADRIMCMGNSAGGSISYYAACLEPRLWLTMPSCCFCTYAESKFRIHHCTDGYIPGILKFAEMPDLAGMIVPRRMVLVAGETDAILPIAGVERGFETVRRIYAAAGVPERLRTIVGSEGHRFYAQQGWSAVRELLPQQ
jgi:hypothetical protein